MFQTVLKQSLDGTLIKQLLHSYTFTATVLCHCILNSVTATTVIKPSLTQDTKEMLLYSALVLLLLTLLTTHKMHSFLS